MALWPSVQTKESLKISGTIFKCPKKNRNLKNFKMSVHVSKEKREPRNFRLCVQVSKEKKTNHFRLSVHVSKEKNPKILSSVSKCPKKKKAQKFQPQCLSVQKKAKNLRLSVRVSKCQKKETAWKFQGLCPSVQSKKETLTISNWVSKCPMQKRVQKFQFRPSVHASKCPKKEPENFNVSVQVSKVKKRPW